MQELNGVCPVTAFTYWLYGGQRYPMAEGYCNASSKSKAALLQTTNDKLWELTFIPLEALEKDALLKRPSVQIILKKPA